MEHPNYNMLLRKKVESESELLYKEHGLDITSFSPLKGGILTGKHVEGFRRTAGWRRVKISIL